MSNSDAHRGTLQIAFTIEVPADRSEYHRARGDTERKSFTVGEWSCTEEDGVRIAAHFRELNKELSARTSITWTGPRTL